jgi:hypothetical protein
MTAGYRRLSKNARRGGYNLDFIKNGSQHARPHASATRSISSPALLNNKKVPARTTGLLLSGRKAELFGPLEQPGLCVLR